MDINQIKIFDKLKDAFQNAHAPFSNYLVSSYIVTNKGNFLGVNVEPDVLNLGICAERNAIFSAISNVGKIEIKEIYILTSTRNGFGTPCGACRQVISQFSNEYTKIILFDLNGNQQVFGINDLLPIMWSKKDLG